MSTPTPGPATSAEARAKAEEQARRDASAAATGAQAVADAVKKVADDAAAAAKTAKAVAESFDFRISGTPGGRFRIEGAGFTGSGTVLLNGKQLETTEWGGELISGKLPADAKSGEVVVWIDDKTQRRGYLKV
jgi:hypothetical protein